MAVSSEAKPAKVIVLIPADRISPALLVKLRRILMKGRGDVGNHG